MLAKSKLNSIVNLVSQSLIDMEISHEFNARKKYEKTKENVRNVSEHSFAEKRENVRLNSANSK